MHVCFQHLDHTGCIFRIFTCSAEEVLGSVQQQGLKSLVDHVLGGGRYVDWGEGADTFLARSDTSALHR